MLFKILTLRVLIVLFNFFSFNIDFVFHNYGTSQFLGNSPKSRDSCKRTYVRETTLTGFGYVKTADIGGRSPLVWVLDIRYPAAPWRNRDKRRRRSDPEIVLSPGTVPYNTRILEIIFS